MRRDIALVFRLHALSLLPGAAQRYWLGRPFSLEIHPTPIERHSGCPRPCERGRKVTARCHEYPRTLPSYRDERHAVHQRHHSRSVWHCANVEPCCGHVDHAHRTAWWITALRVGTPNPSDRRGTLVGRSNGYASPRRRCINTLEDSLLITCFTASIRKGLRSFRKRPLRASLPGFPVGAFGHPILQFFFGADCWHVRHANFAVIWDRNVAWS
jgi:hypothetical protein